MRILTRGDLDGMTSSVLLSITEKVTDIRFAHPKDVQDGKIPCTADDIVVNLPYVPGCGYWFDHHVSEEQKLENIGKFKGAFAVAPSAARVVYDFYANRQKDFAPYLRLLEETDRLDSATLTPDDVTDPKEWILLGLTLDPRTGLGPDFQKYFRWLVEYVKEVPIAKILQHPEVKKRVDRVGREREEFLQVLKVHSRLEGGVILTDFRGQKNLPAGNRFLIYTLHPKGNVEVRIIDGHQGKTVLAVGHSIFNRTCKVNIGDLMNKYGGGGHQGAGTCQLLPGDAEKKTAEILAALKA